MYCSPVVFDCDWWSAVGWCISGCSFIIDVIQVDWFVFGSVGDEESSALSFVDPDELFIFELPVVCVASLRPFLWWLATCCDWCNDSCFCWWQDVKWKHVDEAADLMYLACLVAVVISQGAVVVTAKCEVVAVFQ